MNKPSKNLNAQQFPEVVRNWESIVANIIGTGING